MTAAVYPALPVGDAFDPEILGPWAHQRQLALEQLASELETALTPAARRIVLASLDAFEGRTQTDVQWVNGYVAARCRANLRIAGHHTTTRPHAGAAFDEGYVVGLRDAARRMESWEPDLAEELFQEAELEDEARARPNPWIDEAPPCPSCGTARWVLCFNPNAPAGRWICIDSSHTGPDRFDAEDES